MPALQIDIPHAALLIADFYGDAMGTLPHAVERKCIEKTQRVRDSAHEAGMLVCYSATVFRQGYVEIHDRNKLFAARKHSGQPAVSDPVALIHPALRPRDGEPVVGKHRVNAFFGTDLEVILRAHDVHTLLLLGFATSGVVLSTTRYAADADYRVVVIEDCCADRSATVHDFLCQRIFPFQADVVQSADLTRALGGQ